MEGPRAEKVAVVDEVRARLAASQGAILTEYRGLTVADLAVLRSSLSKAGAQYKIFKNTLVRLAVKGGELEGLEAMLEGPTAIAFVDGDVGAVAKALREFARQNPNLTIKGGVLGANLLSSSDLADLANLPSRNVLLSALAGGLAAPMRQFAMLLKALPQNFAYGLSALVEQRSTTEGELLPKPGPGSEPPTTDPGAAEGPSAPEASAGAETLEEPLVENKGDGEDG